MRFSVIIPIYNVSRYIKRGLDSLLNQTYRDFEVILVDDGSKDDSGFLCDEASKQDDRIKVVHLENCGAGPARNAGIDLANGEYILFFDIDDILPLESLKVINSKLEIYNPQILVFSYREINPYYKTSNEYIFEPSQYHTNIELSQGWVDNLSGLRFNNGFVWNKAYRRDFLLNNNIRFESLRIQQDEVFNLLAYQYADNVSIISDVLYNYYVYQSGNTGNRIIPDRFEIFVRVFGAYQDLMAFWKLKNARLNEFLNNRLFSGLITHINKDIFRSNLPKKKYVKLLEDLFDKDIVQSLIDEIDVSKLSVIQREYTESIKSHKPVRFLIIMSIEKCCNNFKNVASQWIRK